jgi:uncharacterized protein YdeI (YjbR/CyaY-like superfamily)
MDVKFFKGIAELRHWLIQNHLEEEELWVGYYKKHTEKFNFSWSDSVDQYLCFGWIDGLRRSIDEDRYAIRITPRKPNSNWSAVNLKKMKLLKSDGLLYPAGIEIFNKRKVSTSATKKQNLQFSDAFEKEFRQHAKAWNYFMKLAPSVKRLTMQYVMSAKRLDTQRRRLDLVISCSKKQEKIPHLTWKPKK